MSYNKLKNSYTLTIIISLLINIVFPISAKANNTSLMFKYEIEEDTSATTDSLKIELPGSYLNVIPNSYYNFTIKRFILVPEKQSRNCVLSKKLSFFEPYYEGKPFSSGMNNFIYINEAYKIALMNKEDYYTFKTDKPPYEIHYPLNQVVSLPSTIINNLNTYETDEYGNFILDNISSEEIQKVLEPFYFSKYEVSVSEYREFMDWVRQTNDLDSLPYTINETKNISLKSDEDILIKKRVSWIINKEKAYSYKFYNLTDELKKEFPDNNICIAPIDTIELFYPKEGFRNEYFDINFIYLNDIKDKQNYNKYPIVGINYYQALAFLDWKTHFQQKFLDEQGSNLIVEFSLPNSIERRLVYGNSINFDNNNWICDLKLTKNELLSNSLDIVINNNILSSKNDTVTNLLFENNLTEVDKLTSIIPSNQENIFLSREKHLLKNKIQFLDANVSEWMTDTYKDNWIKALNAHKKQFKNSEADKITSSIEDFYNEMNNENGKLVMGGNYIDYRQSMVYSGLNAYNDIINKAGIEQRRFVDPYTQKSTIGFRYVIKVKVKDYERKDSLLRLVGTFNYNSYADYPISFNKYFRKYIEVSNEQKIDSVDEWYFNVTTQIEKLISASEITNGMWRLFIIHLFDNDSIDLAYKYAPKDSLWEQYNDNYIYYFKNLKYDDLPVVNISYEAVNAFNKWATQTYNKGDYLSSFSLPSEKEWEKMARANKKIEYAWGKDNFLEYKLHNLVNIKTPLYDSVSQYVNTNLYKYTNTDSLVLKYIDLPDNISKSIYNDRYINFIKYKKFLDKEFIYHKYPYVIPKSSDNLTNNIGLSNIHGNVSEMIDTSIITKGGSWNDYLKDAKISNSQKWDGKPSPMVGFRQVMNLPEKMDSAMLINIMSRIPPGTVLLTKNFGVDILEMRNIDYLKFINYVAGTYGRNSKQYKDILPKTDVWKGFTDDGTDLSKVYFNNSKFYNNPLVGITYEQAVIYTKWRTEYINNYYKLYHMKYVRSIGVPKKVTYRLPTPEEWDKILTAESIYLPDEGIVYPDYTNPIKEEDAINKRINKGLTSSVFYYWKNKIGLYAFDDNVSEMTSEPGVARGCNWTGGKDNTNCTYKEPTNWIGFRCVVEVEY